VTARSGAFLLFCAASVAYSPTARTSLCLPSDGRFELRYLHSVERTPVVERYRVAADGTLWLEGMRFRSSGWGFPSEGFRRHGAWFETTHPPRRLDGLVLRVSRLSRQELRAGVRVLALYPLAREGAALRVDPFTRGRCPRGLILRSVARGRSVR